MSVRLTVTQRSEAGSNPSTEVVLDDAVITLGRDKACQVVLPQQAVSRNHARICQEGTLFFLEDLGSAYGTQINGKPLPKGEKRLLRNGDVIAIAQYDVKFDRMTELNADVTSEKTSFIARGLVKDAMRGLASGEERYLRFMNGPREGERIEIGDAKELVFGRDEQEADIILKDDLVSRKHAKIRRDWSGTHVEDLGSRNGIKVNKKRVNRKALKDSDELEVGATRFLYVDPSEPAEEPVQISTEARAKPPPPSPQRPASRQQKAVVEEPPEEPEPPPEE
ncbi:FHA domain-containing protein, partial [Pyxidicoccus sp. 3LG]